MTKSLVLIKDGEEGYLYNKKTGEIYFLNETGCILAQGVLEGTMTSAVKQMMEEFDVEKDTALLDAQKMKRRIEEIENCDNRS